MTNTTGRRWVAALALLLPAACRTHDPAELRRIDDAFDRADRVMSTYALRTPGFPKDVPDAVHYAMLLPVGYWDLLIDAFPDRAFERYAAGYAAGGKGRTLARWGLFQLAKSGHRPTFEFFRKQLDDPDPDVQDIAIQILGYAADSSLTPKLISMLPARIRHYEEIHRTETILDTVTRSVPHDPKAVRSILDHLDETARREGAPVIFGLEAYRLRLRLLEADDPGAEAERILKETPDEFERSEFEEWLPLAAARHGLTSVAPVLRRRVEEEYARFREDESEEDLYPAGFKSRFEYLTPQFDAVYGFDGPFLVARYRRALRDLGVPLTKEERKWLDAHRLLRPAREYLEEAGVLSK